MGKIEEENKMLKETFEQIVEILRESNVFPSTDCRLFLEDGVKVVKLIEECQSKLQKIN